MAETARSATVEPSLWRAWWALVRISWQRQAQAKQMVLIALALLAFTFALTMIFATLDRWGMQRWRFPRQGPHTFAEVADMGQILVGLYGPRGGVEAALFGAAREIVTPQVSGFFVFSRSMALSIFVAFLLPMWSLAFACESFGGDRENRSLIWLLSRPLPRSLIYLAKFVALLPWMLLLNIGGFALICLAAGVAGRLALVLYWPAITAATFAFAALFLLFGAFFRRPAIAAIIYSFCLEIVVASMPGYLKRFSIGYYARCMMYDSAAQEGVILERSSVLLPVDGTTGLLVLVSLTVALLCLGIWLFSNKQYHEFE
jgi:ABC-type transport system involved in multi-copper enzyme maturation permease subunit